MPRFARPATASAPPHRWRPPEPAWQRRAQAGAVLAGVLLAHAWLIAPPKQPLGRVTMPGPVPTMQVVTLAPPVAPQPPPPAAAAAPAPAPPQPTEPRAAEPAVTETPEEAPAVASSAGGVEPVAGTDSSPADSSQPPVAKPMLVDEAASAAAANAPDALGVRPPVYLTSPPTAGFQLAYRVERGESRGHGQFRVDLQDDGGYRALLQAEDGQRVVMDWVSRGRFDVTGVAPERMVERQRGRDARAVNFQRDAGVISFSGSSRAQALLAGAQDRASLMLQLMAIAQAQPGGLRAGQALRLQVAGARFPATDWQFEVAGDETIEPGGQRIATVRLVREPEQPYDQRVEVWLARTAGHLPVGLRLTTVPGREPVSLWLDGPLPDTGAPKP